MRPKLKLNPCPVARIEVQNVNQGNLAFETRVYKMTFDENGNIVEYRVQLKVTFVLDD